MTSTNSNFKLAAVNLTFKALTGLLCRVSAESLERIPERGPLIIVANHVNFIDLPIMYPRVYPRTVTGFAKVETWDNPLMAALFDILEAIPIHRGEVDITALRKALHVLEQGKIIAIAPEGTRSGDGRLRRGKPGVVMLALKSGAPLLPVVYYGGEKLRENIRRLRRTAIHIAVGEPFRIDTHGERITHDVREKMVDEIMYQLAALLPVDYRGYYKDLSSKSEDFLRFLQPEYYKIK
jgi:1-acyl-sn-glycerol-3-phosphate acyltransferase